MFSISGAGRTRSECSWCGTGGYSWAEIAIADLAGSPPKPVVGFRSLVPKELDWGPSLGPR